MTPRFITSSGNYTGDEDEETYFFQMNSMMKAPRSGHEPVECGHISDREQYLLPSLTDTSLNPPFSYDADFTTLFQNSAAQFPYEQQITEQFQHEFLQNMNSLPSFPLRRGTVHHNPLSAVPKLQMIPQFEEFPSIPQIRSNVQDFGTLSAAYSPTVGSVSTASPHQSFAPSVNMFCPSPLWPYSVPALPISEAEHSIAITNDDLDFEDEGTYDKPYAKLIYEALMDAPDHRMLLRDIYDWFRKNTRKHLESGGNGWQNSIRHNLSMNQAFENDKSDITANQGARKANSMWMLTEYAIKHGVQSTTRYRKTGALKKSIINRTPAVQRQRSGARGGRAARRAARVRREEVQRRARTMQPEVENPTSFSVNPSPLSMVHDQWSVYSCSPTTPTDSQFFDPYHLSHRSGYDYGLEVEQKYGANAYLDEDEHLRQILSQSTSDETLGL